MEKSMSKSKRKDTPSPFKPTNPSKSTNKNKNSRAGKNVDAVKELGRRARERLAQERNQRPEIVRLEAPVVPTAKQQKPVASKRTIGSSQKNTVASHHPPPKRQRQVSSTSKRRATTSTVAQKQRDPNFDPWMPQTSHVTQCYCQQSDDNDGDATMGTKSTVVMLHGIPMGATPLHIKRFFSGLQPQQIGILLSCPLEIEQWDAKHDLRHMQLVKSRNFFSFGGKDEDDSSRDDQPDDTKQTKQVILQRYPPTFRVVVKFDSSPTAELAADRSGEPIGGTEVADDDARTTIAPKAALGVTHMIKAHANFILQKLMVDTQQLSAGKSAASKLPLDQILSQVEEQILPNVHRILWMDAKRRFRFAFCDDPSLLESAWPVAGVKMSSILDSLPPHSSDNTELLSERHDQLVKVRDSLKSGLPFPAAEILDPLYLSYPSIRLSHEALLVVNQMIEIIEERRLVQQRELLFFAEKD